MKNPLIIYKTEDGKVKIETHFENETVWLNQTQISDLFQKERSDITKHISNIFKDGELLEKSNVQKLHISGSQQTSKLTKKVAMNFHNYFQDFNTFLRPRR
ncbi:MAG: hypothetical protein V3V00_05025 [Saprospiraceae bacterium]